MKHISEHVREAGYEALFHLGGFLALAVHPTPRNQDRIFQWIDESRSRREQCRRLLNRGFIEPATRGTKGGEGVVFRLTELGQTVFAGGRYPESAWDRPWDGTWRLLSFDLPGGEGKARMKLQRWLGANHFGHLQGSVRISPDPIPAIEEILQSDRVESSMFLVFEGSLAGSRTPREVASMAWDFAAINQGYRQYSEFASRATQGLRKAFGSDRVRNLLREDRKRWWEAVRRDPLLPRAVLPKDYEGIGAWQARGKLLKRLGRGLTT